MSRDPPGAGEPGSNLHGSAVALAGRGALILGASGTGKSSLALRLMALGAALVADDRVLIVRRGGIVMMAAPAALRGLIEARGAGLLRAEALDEAPLTLVVDLDRAPAARMPQPREITVLGVEIELMLGHEMPHLDAVVLQMLRCGRAPGHPAGAAPRE